MAEGNNNPLESFQVDELDDSALDSVSGGTGEPINNQCTVNSGNCVAGCACGPLPQ
jgi:hypothetical protein